MDSKYYVRRGLSSPKITRSFLPLWVCVQKYIMVLRVPLSTRWDAVGSNHMQPPTGFITGTEIEEIIIPTSKFFFFFASGITLVCGLTTCGVCRVYVKTQYQSLTQLVYKSS